MQDPCLEATIIGNPVFFYITFSTSFFSAALGLAKTLKVGVTRIVKSDGPLDGLCSVRFISAFLGIKLLITYFQLKIKTDPTMCEISVSET